MTERGERVGVVRDWMSRAPVGVEPQCPVAKIVRVMRSQNIRHVLVLDGSRLAGVVSSRDVRARLGDEELRVTPDTPVAQLMTESPVTVGPDVPLIEAARAMLDRKIGALPVLDGEQIIGILTKSDVLEALLAWAEQGGPPTGRPL